MPSRRTKKRRHHFDSSVGSSSDDCDKIKGPSGAINCEHYNSLDGPLRLNFI